MRLSIVWSARAADQLRETTAWIAERSPEGAQRWLDALELALDQIATRGASMGRAPEDVIASETIYQKLFRTRRGRTYRALFIVRGQIVHIVSLRAPGQQTVGLDDLTPEQ